MIDIKLIREQPDQVRAAIAKKHTNPAILDALIEVDAERRALRQETEANQATQNTLSARMPSEPNQEELRTQLKALSDEIKVQRAHLSELDEKYLVLMRQIPNIPAAEVPEGVTDKQNVVVKTVGEKKSFDFVPKDHEELAGALDLLDMERAAKVTGAKFYYLKNELVILEQAVMRFALDILKSKGFTLMRVPMMVRKDALYGSGHFASPEDEIEGDIYKIDRDELYLTGTAEVGLASYHAGEIMPEAALPLRYVGISSCFRREAGTYGKETRGLFRVHEFQKIEMFSYARPEDSEKEHELLLSLAEDLLQKLGLSYQVVLNCGGDLGLPQYKKWDIETWLPGMNKYGETHSASNDTDYQARTLNIRFRRSDPALAKETEFVHTLNNTALASARILIALLETYQRADGSIEIPEVLIPYTGFSEIRLKD